MDLEVVVESSESEYNPGASPELSLQDKYNQEYDEKLLDSDPQQILITKDQTSDGSSPALLVAGPDEVPAMASNTSIAPNSTETLGSSAIEHIMNEIAAAQCLVSNLSHAESTIASNPDGDVSVPKQSAVELSSFDDCNPVNQSADSTNHSVGVESHSQSNDEDYNKESVDKTSSNKLGKGQVIVSYLAKFHLQSVS